MSEPDDFSALAQFEDCLGDLDKLMDQNGKVFLIGAGCSTCAGLPLMEELTTKVLESDSLDSTTKAVLQGTQIGFSGAKRANIEDYLSEIVDILAIVDRRTNCCDSDCRISVAGTEYTNGQLRDAAENIKRAIADVIASNDRQMDISTHRNFVQTIHHPRRPGRISGNDPVYYLCLNYDTLLEDALALEKISFADGLEGGATGWWNPGVFDRDGLSSKLYKLHGSIDWCSLDDDPLPRRVASNVAISTSANKRVLIWPASTKYRETQRDPYAQLMQLARDALKSSAGSQKILLICGYSFGDAHINLEVDRALRESAGRLTVVVFTGDDVPRGQVQTWCDDTDIGEQVLVFAKRGFFHGEIRKPSESTDLPWWKFENVSRLLGGER
ncbi:MAG TPA: SIR2 family protein [Candidatus Cryosericum sp.]|nr:SIR2 family protein [Candidatus Cryosericum sp.]